MVLRGLRYRQSIAVLQLSAQHDIELRARRAAPSPGACRYRSIRLPDVPLREWLLPCISGQRSELWLRTRLPPCGWLCVSLPGAGWPGSCGLGRCTMVTSRRFTDRRAAIRPVTWRLAFPLTAARSWLARRCRHQVTECRLGLVARSSDVVVEQSFPLRPYCRTSGEACPTSLKLA